MYNNGTMPDHTSARKNVGEHSGLLARLTSADNAGSTITEVPLKHFDDPSYYLIEFALISTARGSVENSVTARQIAANLLRQYVDEQGGEQPGGSGEISTEVKKKLVEILLLSLGGSDAEIRDSNAHVIAAIVKQDWTSTWKQVMPVLMTMTNKTDDINAVLGSFKVIAAIFDGTFYNKEFLQCCYSLLPSIAQLVLSPQATDSCRIHAMNSLPHYIDLMARAGGSTFDGEVRLHFK